MKKFIKELRRREVFRTAGLYVGICWILIEVGSVVLPIVDAPEWLFRGSIIAAFAGFPVMVVLAWIFDVNEEGIGLQADPTDTTVEQPKTYKKDFAIIGLMVLALIVSLSLNITNETSVTVELEPVSVLVAHFGGTTDDPMFEGVLEEALVVGLEVAPHIGAFDGSDALQVGRQTKPGTQILDLDLAHQVAKQQGINVLLAGSLEQSGNGYRITVEGIDVLNDQSTFKINEKADSPDAVLQAIGKLSAKARKKLGDTTSSDLEGGQAQVFVAASLKAARAYVSARQLEKAGKLEEAVEQYKQATAADPNFGRAFSSLALAEFTLGRKGDADAHWTKALSLMNTLTERERLHALGHYQASVANDGDKAAKIYAELVDKYPADVGARKLYAVVAFGQLDFAKAIKETRKILEMFPADSHQQTKLALYAMYGGDWETARKVAERVVAADAQNGTAWLPLAMAALARGEVDAARDAYQNMAAPNNTTHGASVAELGLADIELYFGLVDDAQARLKAGIESDKASGDDHMAALKHIALAQSYADQENFPAATDAGANALLLSDDIAAKVSVAMIYLQAGSADDINSVRTIADALSQQADSHSRACGQMLNGMILQSGLQNEDTQTKAILAMRDASSTADLWLIRYQLGKAYLRSGNYTEALDKLMTLKVRSGEATAVFLDDMPTYRLVSELPYWIGRVQEELKTPAAARASYEKYVSLRPQGGALAQDAKERAARLN